MDTAVEYAREKVSKTDDHLSGAVFLNGGPVCMSLCTVGQCDTGRFPDLFQGTGQCCICLFQHVHVLKQA